MADPFFQKTTNSTSNQQQINEQIQQLNQQQQLLQQQYAQLNNLLQNSKITPEQRQKTQSQMQEFNNQFQKNLEALKRLWAYKPTTTMIKKWSRISVRWFVIWCAILLMIVIWWMVGVFYYLMKNPTQLSSVWLDPTNAKTLLQSFAVIFFGLLAFLGIWIVINDLYKIITVKNKSKIWYIFWLVLWFLLLLLSIVIGASVLNKVKTISVENILDADKLIMPYIQFKDWIKYTRWDATLHLIAPAQIFYKLNTDYFNWQIVPILWQVTFSQINLDCGNWQIIPLNLSSPTADFDGSCIYFKKWEYNLNLNMSYLNIPTWEKLKKTTTWWTIVFESEISVTPAKWELTFNDSKTEMIVGKVPSKVTFDASNVFTDLKLPSYQILRDVNGDGQMDNQNSTNFTYTYKQAQLYNVAIRFPWINNYIYTFPIRVEQSDVPVCEIQTTQIKWTQYSFITNFLDSNVNANITDYQFDIIDKNNKSQIIDTIKNKNWTFEYVFPWKWVYAVRTTFITAEDKQWDCESDNILVWSSDFQVSYDVFFKSPQSPQFQKATSSSATSFSWDTINIQEIPTFIKISLNQITPDNAGVSKKVLFDDLPVLSTDSKNFEIKIEDSKIHTITIVIQDVARWSKTQIPLTVQTDLANLIGKLIVRPGTVGTDPFTVTFDASTTTLNDPADEIVYFTRNFWDGEIKKNLSQAIIIHTYRYNYSGDNWEYHPVLTIKTKKWRQINISPETNIIVKKAIQTLKINVDSHPAQVANVGEKVDFSLQINWTPTSIDRDFWNGKTLHCKSRGECASTSTSYSMAWTYTVKANVAYDNQPSIDGEINILVR